MAEAETVLSDGIENNPIQGFLYYHRACVRNLMSKKENALSDLKRAIELDDFFEKYSKTDEELEGLRPN